MSRPDDDRNAPAGAALPVLTLADRASLRLDAGSLARLETDVLPAYLRTRRWFAQDKPAGPARLDELHALPGADDTLSLHLALVQTPDTPEGERVALVLGAYWDQQPEQPLARLRCQDRQGWLAETAQSAAFAGVLLQAWREDWSAGPLRAEAEQGLAALATGRPPALKVLQGEQSNSSSVIDGAAVLKLIRRVPAGVSPEAEMTRHLTRCGYTHAPALLGALQHTGLPGPRTLAVLHGFVPNHGDAWKWLLDEGRRTLEAAAREGREPDWSTVRRVAARIGERLGQMHAILSQDSDDADFQPEQVAASHVEQRSEQVRQTLARACEGLAPRAAALSPRGRASADWLAEHQGRLDERIGALCQAEAGSHRIRVHGDFHLGQVLLSEDDATLIDFEGEPANPLALRRARHSPYKDVAGMLRSFDYAAATLAGETQPGQPALAQSSAPQQQRDTALATFREAASQAFLEAYHQAYPLSERLDPARRAALLELCLLEKAAYEIVYECAHRPDWIEIPLNGLTELARRALMDAAINKARNPL